MVNANKPDGGVPSAVRRAAAFSYLTRQFNRRQTSATLLAERHRRSGQSLVELALVLPMLLLLASGAFELGRLYITASSVSHAAREGARAAMDPTVTDAQVAERVAESGDRITIDPADVRISPRTPGERVTVEVTYRFSSPVPLINLLWDGGSLEITRSRVGRVQD